jgi:hypothetical protein
MSFDLGWSLLACPWDNVRTADVALFTLNPGGRDISRGVSEEAGSAYVIQDWLGRGAGVEPLQRQVQRLFALADVEPASVLAGYLVPFRSPSWAELGRSDEALAFGRNVWLRLLNGRRPRLTFTMSDLVFRTMRSLFDGTDVERILLEWGAVTMQTCDYEGGRLIGLPHLSRYRLLPDESRAHPTKAPRGRASSRARFRF